MPTTREIQVYKFDELSDKAKEHAREMHRAANADDTYWFETIIEDAAAVLPALGFAINEQRNSHRPAIYFSGFCSQGDGACFEGSWSPETLKDRDALRAEYPVAWKDADGVEHACPDNVELQAIADESHRLAALDPTRGISWRATHSGRYSHEHSVSFEHYDEREAEHCERADQDNADCGGPCNCLCDCDRCKVAPLDIEKEHEANARDAMRWIYRQLEAEYEYQNADEQVDESIRANEYEFDVDGKHI